MHRGIVAQEMSSVSEAASPGPGRDKIVQASRQLGSRGASHQGYWKVILEIRVFASHSDTVSSILSPEMLASINLASDPSKFLD